MKKRLAFVFVIICLLGLISCNNTAGNGEQPSGEDKTDLSSSGNPDKNEIGVTMTAKDVTKTGLTLVVTQSGYTPTGELMTGSFYAIEKLVDGVWLAEETTIPSEDLAWTTEAYLIATNGSTELNVDWSFLYGELDGGSYRIQKSIMDFREAGDYDNTTVYAEFSITE